MEQDLLMILASKLANVNIHPGFYQAGWQNTITLLPHVTYLCNRNFEERAKSAKLALKKKKKQTAQHLLLRH